MLLRTFITDLTNRRVSQIICVICWFAPFVIFLTTVYCSEAQANEDQAHRVLASNVIRSISADAENVWIATDNGVSRFSKRDGRWTSYTKEDGLVSDNVYFVTSDGAEVWFGTDNGVSRLILYPASSVETWTTYREKDGLISNKTNCIIKDRNYIWIGTDRGLARFDRNIGSWAARTQDDGLTTNFVRSIAVEKDSVWVGTEAIRGRHDDDWRWREEKRRSGLNRYDKNTDSWNTYTPEEGLLSGQISTVAADEDTVWIGTSDGGISCYSKKDQAFVKSYSKSEILDTNNIKFIFVDSIYTWIGTANSGVYRYIKTTDTWMQYTVRDGLVSDHITSIAVLGDEVWFGAYENGVSKYNKLTQKWTTYVKASYLADNDVRDISVNVEEVWAATTRGLSRYDVGMRQWTTYGIKDGLTCEYITHVESYADDVFISMEDCLGRFHRKTGKWSFYTDFIDSSALITALEIVEIQNTAPLLLIGTAGDGVFKLPLNSGSASGSAGIPARITKLLTPDQLPDPGVTSIESNSTRLWVGARAGFSQYNYDAGKDAYASTASQRIGHVNVMLQNDDSLWIGTISGLLKYDIASMSWETFTSSDGLPGDNVRALALPAQSGERGAKSIELRAVSGEQEEVRSPTSYALSSTPYALGSRLWIGTSKGLALLGSDDTGYEIRTALFSETRTSFYNNIRSIGVSGDTLWIATGAGTLEFSPSTGEWREHRAEPRKTPFIESGVTNVEFDGTDVWASNWISHPSGCIARFDRTSKSWLRYTIRDILNVKPEAKASTITNVRKIVPQRDRETKGQEGKENHPISPSRYVWFATDWGILKYDKELDRWRHYTTEDGLVDNNVRYLVLGGDTVWASSSGRKINKYDEQSDEWLTMRFQDSRGMEENPIEREGEWRLEDMERREQEDRWSSVRDMVIADGSIWFRMGEGITFFNEYTKDLKRFTAEDGLVSDRVRCLEYDGRNIWVGHEPDEWAGVKGGISRYDVLKSEWTSYSDTTILATDRIDRIRISEDLVWFLPDRHSRSGATGYDTKQNNWFTLKPEADSENEDNNGGGGSEHGIVEVMNDGENFWIGTMRSGLLQFHTASGSWRFLTDRENILNNIVMRDGLNVDENLVWLGTIAGLRLYDKELETWTTYTKPTSLMGNEVRAIAADERYVWCGTEQGISRYDKTEGTWTQFKMKGGRIQIRVGNDTWDWWQGESREGLMDNNITGLTADDRYLWVTTHQGANRYDKIADIWDRYSKKNGLPTRSLTAVAADDSHVWVSTNKGLCSYPGMSDDPNAWVTYTSMIEIRPMVFSQEYASSLVSNKIRTVAAEKDYIWAGTERGVSRYDKRKDTWLTFTHEDGLIDDAVGCIAVDEDNVWFGTAKGVTRYTRKTQDWVTFTTENGLPSDQVTCIAIDSGSVWFGTFDAGLARYDEQTDSWEQFTEDDGLAHTSVLSMVVDGNFVWIGTRRGLTRYDKQTSAWTVYRSIGL